MLAAALAAGILAADRGLLGVVAGQVLALQSLLLGLAVRQRPALRLACAALALSGAGAHALALRREEAYWPAAVARVEAIVEARVASLVRRGDAAFAVLEDVRSVDGGPPLPHRVRIRSEGATGGFAAIASSGDRVRARVRLRPVTGRANPGLPDPALRARRAGIGGEGTLVHPALAVREARGPLQRLRAAAVARRREAADRLAARGAGLAAALAFGERGHVDPRSEEVLRAAGLAHLLSVSGLHLALAAGLVFAGVRLALLRLAPGALPDPRRAALAAAWIGAAGYAALTGFDVPVRRSLVFLSVACAAALARRPASGGHLIAAAGLAVLAGEPEALFDPGARLSFAAAAALVLARGPAPHTRAAPAVGWRARATRALDASLRTSAAALAASAPLAALHFGRVAPAALAANLAAVPLTGVVILPASLAAAGAAALAPGWPGLAVLPADVSRAGGAALDALARLAIRGPGAERVVAVGPATLALAAACAVAALRARATGARLLAAALGHGAILLAPAPALLPAAPRMVAFDVGQGDATLVQGREAALLVDAGGAPRGGSDLGRAVVRPALAALGVERLALFAVSHADLDHRGGAAAVLEGVPVDLLWLGEGALDDPAFADLLAAARRHGVPVATRARGDAPVALGDLVVEVLWPPPVGESPHALSDNDRSLVLRVSVAGGARVLLPGDVEGAGESGLLAAPGALAADVLKLPHHGSRTSSGDALLRAAGAAIAIASAPCLGRFGMPHPEVAARVARGPTSLWWTGRDGAVAISLAPPFAVRGFAEPISLRERAFCGGR